MRKTVVNFLTLRPHGGNLCGPEVAFWLLFANIALQLMCLAEALAWGYVGFEIGAQSSRYIGASVVGAVAWFAVLSMDATFLSQDLQRVGFQRRLDGLTSAATRRTWRDKARLKPLVGFGVRLLMVAGSLTVAAPYVSQLFFYREISTVLAERDATTLRDARARVAGQFDTQIQQIDRERQAMRRQIVDEAAGSGPSGRLGRGPVVRTMEDQAADLDRRLAAAQGAKAVELERFDRDPASELFRRYGVNLGADGVHARNDAMEQIRRQPGFAQTEWTVRAILLGLFLVLIVIKWYEPFGAQIYYSAVCQDAYRAYMDGHFVGVVPQEDPASRRGPMTPICFYKWLCNNLAGYERQMQLRTRLQNIESLQKAEEHAIVHVREAAEKDLQPMFAHLKQAQAAAEQAQVDVLDTEAEVEALTAQAEKHLEAIEAIDSAISYPRAVGSADHFVAVINTRASWTAGLGDVEKQQKAAAVKLSKAQARLADCQSEVARIQHEVDARWNFVMQAEQAVTDSRQQALNDIKQSSN